MVHSRQNRELHEGLHQRRNIERTVEERSTDQALAQWLRLAPFRRVLNRALQRHGITFSQWRVLDAAERLVREYDDNVGQYEIAAQCELDEGTASKVLRRLGRLGLVDTEPEFWGQLNGVLMTKKGRALLGDTRGMLIRVARQTLEGTFPGSCAA
jgi:DNA-binding MarR family transcriptional regulator